MASAQQDSVTAPAVMRLQIQKWAAKSRSWIAIVILTPFVVGCLLSVPWAYEGSWGDFLFDSVGWSLFVAGATFRWWSTLYIGGRKTSQLVTHGPYSICRNPIYLGTFLMACAVGAFLQSLTFMIGLLLASFLYLSTTVSAEERRLSEHFGDQFTEYCKRVPRFLPKFKSFESPAIIEVSLSGLAAEGYRAARWIWLPIICILAAQLRAQPYWPHVFKLP